MPQKLPDVLETAEPIHSSDRYTTILLPNQALPRFNIWEDIGYDSISKDVSHV